MLAYALIMMYDVNVCVYIGKAFGKHKLSSISSAAGSASPNKTVGMYALILMLITTHIISLS